MPKAIISCANIKGGEGKTTISRHLAHFADEAGLRVLAIDLDPQRNLTRTLTPDDAGEVKQSSVGLFDGSITAETFAPVRVSENLDLLPAARGLAALHMIALDTAELVKRAKAAVRAIAQSYDVVVIDTPTNAESCYMAGLAASTAVVSPMQLDVYGLDGATDFQAVFQVVRSRFNPRLAHVGYVINRYNARAASHKRFYQQAQEAGLRLVRTPLRERIAVQDAAGRRTPVWRNPGGTVNRRAAEEFRGMCRDVFAGAGVEL